jgi:hypothetical protein
MESATAFVRPSVDDLTKLVVANVTVAMQKHFRSSCTLHRECRESPTRGREFLIRV